MQPDSFMRDNYENNWKKAKSEAAQKGLTIVDYGWEQHVIIDEEAEIVYRYPRHDAAAAKLDDEVNVLKAVNEKDWPISLPIMIEHKIEYTSYKFIPGRVLDDNIVDQLKDDDFVNIGKDLGKFLTQFHKLDKDIVLNKKTSHHTSLLEYYERRIHASKNHDLRLKALPDLQNLLLADRAKEVVVHGDLHGPNVVIDRDNKLKGVIDLSEMEIGDPHHEFRKIFMTFPKSLKPALSTYGGQKLSQETIKLWAYVNEWANLCFFCDQPRNLTYQRALKNLQGWGKLKGGN